MSDETSTPEMDARSFQFRLGFVLGITFSAVAWVALAVLGAQP